MRLALYLNLYAAYLFNFKPIQLIKGLEIPQMTDESDHRPIKLICIYAEKRQVKC